MNTHNKSHIPPLKKKNNLEAPLQEQHPKTQPASSWDHKERSQAPLLTLFSPPGNTSPTQKEPTPFIIEWIPNILPHSRIGELRIKFEYGHHGSRQPPAFSEQQAPALEPALELAPLATITFP